MTETLILLGAVALVGMAAYRAFGDAVAADADCYARGVQSLAAVDCARASGALPREAASSPVRPESDATPSARTTPALSLAAAPARAPRRAPADGGNLEKIREALEGNLSGNVTTGTLRDITRAFEEMTPEERQAVIAGLGDDELADWMDEVGGAWGGLSGEEKRQLYGVLAEGLDGEQLARVARAVFAEVPESEHEFIDSVVARADAATQLGLIEALTADIDAEGRRDFDVYLGSTRFTKTYGDAETRTVVATLAHLGRNGGTEFDRAIAGLASAGKLDETLLVASGRVDSTGVVANGSPSLIRSSFAPGPLLDIIDAAARSDDPEVRRQVLEASAPALGSVEFSDEILQQTGIEQRPETPRIAASLYGLLELPPPKPEWTPPSSLLGESDYTDDPERMLQRLKEENVRVQEAGQYYRIDPRAIALVADVEARYNNGLARQAGLGRGRGYGQMHHSAAAAQHPEWSFEQSEAARNNAAYAPPLVAADMDAKARAFELVTGGQISIRNDPVALAWAYNNSLATVTQEATKAREALERGEPVVLDLKQGSELGEYGMAGHAKRDLENGTVDDFASATPPPPSPVEYRAETL